MLKIDRNKPLPKHTKLDYYECYAKVVLEDLFPERYADLCILDKPDLQDVDMNIGVEVTSAVPKEEREAVRLWYMMPFVSAEKQKVNKERMKLLGVEYQGGVQFWPVKCYSYSNMEDYPVGEFLKAVANKVEKLNNGHYREFNFYDLFVYSEIFVDAMFLQKVLERLIIINNKNKKFANIYWIAQEKFIFFDFTMVKCAFVNYLEKQGTYASKARQMVIQGEENDQI